MDYNWTGLNVKLLAASALLFWIGVILASSRESRRSSCTLHKIVYWASGAPSGIYWCANCRPTWCGRSDLCSYWLTQKRRCLWLVAHKTALHWYGRLAGRPVTKLIGYISYRRHFSIYRKEDVLFLQLPPINSKTSRGPYYGQHLSIFVNIVEIYLMRQSL